MLCLVVIKKFFGFETSNEKILENLSIMLGIYFNYNLNTNRRLKCHIGRDNQNSILAIKKIDIYVKSKSDVIIQGSICMNTKQCSNQLCTLKYIKII